MLRQQFLTCLLQTLMGLFIRTWRARIMCAELWAVSEFAHAASSADTVSILAACFPSAYQWCYALLFGPHITWYTFTLIPYTANLWWINELVPLRYACICGLIALLYACQLFDTFIHYHRLLRHESSIHVRICRQICIYYVSILTGVFIALISMI